MDSIFPSPLCNCFFSSRTGNLFYHPTPSPKQTGAHGWTWTPPSSEQAEPVKTHLSSNLGANTGSRTGRLNLDALRAGQSKVEGFSNTEYFCEYTNDPNFPMYDTYELTGNLGPQGGNVKVHNDNGTFADTTITFSAPFSPSGSSESLRNLSMSIKPASGKHVHYTGISIALQGEPLPIILEWTNPSTKAVVSEWRQGAAPPPPPPQGESGERIIHRMSIRAHKESFINRGLPLISPTLWPYSLFTIG